VSCAQCARCFSIYMRCFWLHRLNAPLSRALALTTVCHVILHRCMLLWPDLHVSRKARRSAHKYTLTVNRSFDEVLAGINKQHGDNWFFKPIKEILRLLNVQHPTSPAWSMTWELWEGDMLVAGEAGLVVGACYVSLSGFYTRDGAGTVQIAAMAKALESAGFGLLDFGQVSLSLCCTITINAHGTCCFRCLFSLCIEPAFDIPI
jgi:hypothetical protein